jgi:predicted AlkP superfamily pyrophosphatase or phosphodiesterase
MSKVILVVSDGLRDDTAAAQMGYLEHMVEHGLGTRFTVRAEMPTVSRVLYETIHTGMPPHKHGITSNGTRRMSNQPNLFQLARAASLTTGAVAYYWYSELYNRYPFDPVDDKEVDDPALTIQHGRFFVGDAYPDADMLPLATAIARKYAPDYLLIHPMSMDHTGETYGADTAEYRNMAISQDQIFGVVVPDWLGRGYTVLITADHGVNRDRSHGGSTPDVRHVPLYALKPGQRGRGNTTETVSQLRIAPTVCRLLGIQIPSTMLEPPLEI